jgi:putative NADH-flavin reductase
MRELLVARGCWRVDTRLGRYDDAARPATSERNDVRLAVAGASGRTGQLFTELALAHGHDVTALVRDPEKFAETMPPHAHLCVVRWDALAGAAPAPSLAETLAGHDAVISLLAPRPRTNGRVYVEGTRTLADAAVAAGARRFVVVSAEGAGVRPGVVPWAYRVVLRIPVVARLYPDIAQMERELVARDDLDWTVVRAAILTNGPRTGAWRVAEGDAVPGGLMLSRADLAEMLLATVEGGEWVRERVAVAR